MTEKDAQRQRIPECRSEYETEDVNSSNGYETYMYNLMVSTNENSEKRNILRKEEIL